MSIQIGDMMICTSPVGPIKMGEWNTIKKIKYRLFFTKLQFEGIPGFYKSTYFGRAVKTK